MKWFAAILFFLNLGLFGYFYGPDHTVNQAGAVNPEVHPEQIKIVSASELEAMQKKPEPAPPAPVAAPAPACYEWGSFNDEVLGRAQSVLGRLALRSEVVTDTPQDALRYWIYIPPLPSAEKAQAKNTELRALGVTETFVIQEPKWRNAISLGVFKDEALATRFLDDLRARGVRSAIKGVRKPEHGVSSVHLRDVPQAAVEELNKVQPDFPGSAFRKVDCLSG